MKEILRTLDKVKLSWAQSVLKEAGIECFVMDENMGNTYHGMFGVAPRLMVTDDDAEEAVTLLKEIEDI